ncbi:MAG: TPM domain-containing protein [Deltaproteobacteria bacterium]|nr:TPM domain-containing protein [Deltaproteobacteria bacterium]
MKKIYYILICLAGIVTFLYPASKSSGEPPFPKPRGAVNDFASLIPEREERMMENISREVLQKTGTAIVIATVDTVGDSDYETYANELYANWGIGKKGEDKGVLIFLTKKERKVRIETGYGVEGILPDGLVGQILDDYIVPFLKKGDYGKGLLNGTIAISQIIAKDAGVKITGQSQSPYSPRYQPRRKSLGSRLFSFLFFIILILLVIRNPLLLPFLLLGMGGRGGGSFGGFSGGFGGFGGGLSGGGGAGRGF